MSRAEGFDVMDVSTAIVHDPKLRRLSREHPEQLGTAFLVYMATMAESWKAGERLTVDDAWPSFLPFDDLAVTALQAVRLIDDKGRVLSKAWRGWFEVARSRRDQARERWRKANAKRHNDSGDLNGNDNAGTARQPRGNRVATAPNVPSVPNPESLPNEGDSLERGFSDARANGHRRADVQALHDRGWKRVTKAQRSVLDEVLARHDRTGPEFAAEAIRNAPTGVDPLEAVMVADRLWQEAQRHRADAEESSWAETKAAERREAAERIDWLEQQAPR